MYLKNRGTPVVSVDSLHFHFLILTMARVASQTRLEEVTPLEVCVGMHNSIKLRGFPGTVTLDRLKLGLVSPVEDSIAGNVVSFLIDIFLYSPENVPIMDTCCLQQAGQVIYAEVPVRTSMTFPTSRRMLCQNLLA